MSKILKKNKQTNIGADEQVRVIKMGKIIEIQQSSIRGKGGKIKKIDKDTFVNTETGEVKHFKKHNVSSRKENYNSLYKTLRNAKEMINANFKGVEYTTWITLTYKEKMCNVKKFDKDFEAFIKKLRRHYSDNPVKYIIALEIGANGGFHCHCLLYWENKAPSFSTEDLNSLWNMGNSYTENLKNISGVRNIGAYLTSHLTDMPYEEYKLLHRKYDKNNNDIKSIKTTNADFSFKKIVKNARLELYPPNFRIFRHSKCMKKGDKKYDTYSNAMKEIKDDRFDFTYYGNIEIITDENFIISQQYEYYERSD